MSIDSKKNIIDMINFRETIAGQKPKTVAKKLSAVRSFMGYLEELGHRFHLYSLDSIKTPKGLPKPATDKQSREVLGDLGDEEALIIRVLYGLGLRISEARELKIADIGEHFARVVGKGNKTREVPIFEDLRARIARHLERAKPLVYLFEENGKPLSDNQLRYKVTNSFEKAGLKVTPHRLRHSFATEMLNSGAGIVDVSEILGHAQLSTTEIYTKLSSSVKLQSYLAAHPLCKKGDKC
jgi:integrase/recombinase XerC